MAKTEPGASKVPHSPIVKLSPLPEGGFDPKGA